MRKSQRRLYSLMIILAAAALSLGLALYALKDNVQYFYSPRDVKTFQEQNNHQVEAGRVFRLGGMVEKGSLEKRGGDLNIRFVVTDFDEKIAVSYHGLLPDLFREGQGVVATGSLDASGVFIAREILAKHDENYMPPEVKKALAPQEPK